MGHIRGRLLILILLPRYRRRYRYWVSLRRDDGLHFAEASFRCWFSVDAKASAFSIFYTAHSFTARMPDTIAGMLFCCRISWPSRIELSGLYWFQASRFHSASRYRASQQLPQCVFRDISSASVTIERYFVFVDYLDASFLVKNTALARQSHIGRHFSSHSWWFLEVRLFYMKFWASLSRCTSPGWLQAHSL